MAARIHGLAIDTKGRAVAGARVLLGLSFLPEPPLGELAAAAGAKHTVAVTSATGEYVFAPETHPFLGEFLRDNQLRAQAFGSEHQHELSVRAMRDESASKTVILEWSGEDLTVPDLVLEPGLVGRVVARWSDDALAAGVSIDVTLQDQQSSHADKMAALLSFEGATDERGELAFGPVLDRDYRIIVRASHPEEPPHSVSWESRNVHDEIQVTLPRGRSLRGRVVTASGRPAAGYRVAPSSEQMGDPEETHVVELDDDGRFELPGVERRGGAIAIYDRLPALPRKGDRPTPEQLAALMDVDRPGNPLLIHDVPDDETDIGSLTLPAVGTFAVRLEDARGGRPLSGHSFWRHSATPHGSRGFQADEDGIVRFERIPLGVAIDLDVSIQDAEHGKLEQRFAFAEVKEESITLRVTGAGTVVLRLHPFGAPDEPLKVRDSWANFGECHGLAHERGWTSELRGWVAPGVYPTLSIEARDFRTRVIEDLRVRDDGPTFVDVELEPQSGRHPHRMRRWTSRARAVLWASWPALLGWSVAFGNRLAIWLIDNGKVGSWPGHWLGKVVAVALVVCLLGTCLAAARLERGGCVFVVLNVSALFALMFSFIAF